MDGNVLATSLDALGQDSRLRKANLLNLVPSLSRQETRDLVACLSAVDFRTDMVPCLPTELLLLIADHIHETEISSLLHVSRRWRATWLRPEILRLWARRFFPGFLEHISAREKRTGEAQDVPALFLEAARIRRLRSLGLFRSALIVNDWVPESSGHSTGSLAPSPHLHPAGRDRDAAFYSVFSHPKLRRHGSSESHLYCAGRLAWQPDNLIFPDRCVVIVDDLRLQTRKIFRPPDLLISGHAAILRALGNELVVAAAGRRIFAWHVESNELQQVTVPDQPTSFVSTGNVVIMASTLNSVFVWEFGGRVWTVDRTGVRWPPYLIGRALARDFRLFSDPLQEGFFYAAAFSHAHPRHRGPWYLFVYKFSLERFVDSFQLRIDAGPWKHFTTPCQRAGSYGDFVVLAASDAAPNATLARGSEPNIALVVFNVFTDSFSIQPQNPPQMARYTFPSPLSQILPRWNHHVTPTSVDCVIGEPYAHPPPRPLGEPTLPPIYTMRWERAENGDAVILRRQRSAGLTEDARDAASPSFALCLVPPSPFRGYQDQVIDILQDDDFLVAMTTRGYTVWSFHTGLTTLASPG